MTITFEQSIESWFESLSDWTRDKFNREKLAIVRAVLDRFPTRKSLDILRGVVVKSELPDDIKRAVLKTINNVKSFSEFGRKFHRYPIYTPYFHQCSATGEIFSLLRQAIDYFAFLD